MGSLGKHANILFSIFIQILQEKLREEKEIVFELENELSNLKKQNIDLRNELRQQQDEIESQMGQLKRDLKVDFEPYLSKVFKSSSNFAVK